MMSLAVITSSTQFAYFFLNFPQVAKLAKLEADLTACQQMVNEKSQIIDEASSMLLSLYFYCIFTKQSSLFQLKTMKSAVEELLKEKQDKDREQQRLEQQAALQRMVDERVTKELALKQSQQQVLYSSLVHKAVLLILTAFLG